MRKIDAANIDNTYATRMEELINSLEAIKDAEGRISIVREMYELTGVANDRLRSLYSSNLDVIKHLREKGDLDELRGVDEIMKKFEVQIDRNWNVLSDLQTVLNAAENAENNPKENSEGIQ